MRDVGRSPQARIQHRVRLPVQAQCLERHLDELTQGVLASAGDDVVVGGRLLQHQPHRAHVLRGPAPIALDIDVAKMQFLAAAVGDATGCRHHLARDETVRAQGRLVIEKDARAGEQTVRFAVVPDGPVRAGLRHGIRAARTKCGFFVGGRRQFAETFAGTGVVQARFQSEKADRFEQVEGP